MDGGATAPKTVSIWWFVLVFVVAGGIGLYWFLTHGNPHAPTEQLNPPTTTTALAAEPDATTPIPTMPDGTKAPSDISYGVERGRNGLLLLQHSR